MKQGFIALAIALLISGPAYADNERVQEPRGEQRRPPAEALMACASSVAGDPCSFEGHRGETVEGSCEAPDDKPLACRPSGGPPQEALEFH